MEWQAVMHDAARTVCDPVMGDDGRLYVPDGAAATYRDALVPLASVLTPNQFEAEQLTGMPLRSARDALAACRALHARGPHTVARARPRTAPCPALRGCAPVPSPGVTANPHPPAVFTLTAHAHCRSSPALGRQARGTATCRSSRAPRCRRSAAAGPRCSCASRAWTPTSPAQARRAGASVPGACALTGRLPGHPVVEMLARNLAPLTKMRLFARRCAAVMEGGWRLFRCGADEIYHVMGQP